MIYWLTKLISVPFSMFLLKEVKGLDNLPKERGFILASNHCSHLDPIIIPSLFIKQFKRKVHYLAKEELFKPWILNKVLKAAEIIPIDKKGRNKKALENALDALKQGKIIGIFPEGGRTKNGKLCRGKTGVTRLALEAKVPVVPVGIKGSYELWPVHQRIFKFKKAIYVNIGKPMYFNKYYNKKVTKKLLRSITTKIMKQIANLSRQEYRP